MRERRIWLAAMLALGVVWLAAPARGQGSQPVRTPHFVVRFDGERVTAAAAQEAGALAEAAYSRCRQLFGVEPPGRILLILTPQFAGATGYTTQRRGQFVIGIRWADLKYLGLSGAYVVTHEVAHVFTYSLASSPLGEGIADYAAGGFGGLKLAEWWGPVLRQAKLWVEPRALFITGDYPAGEQITARLRTARYAEAALLVRYLVNRFGWRRFAAFAKAYGEARRTLLSNSEPSGAANRWGRAVKPPDVDAAEAVFQDKLGVDATRLLADWAATLRPENGARPPTPAAAERLVLAHTIYGEIRGYEGWLLQRKLRPPATLGPRIRAAFTAANAATGRGDFPEAWRQLDRALTLVEQLKRPSRIARHPTNELAKIAAT